MTTFEPCDSKMVGFYLPKYYDKTGVYFAIMKDGKPVGVTGYWEIDKVSCEIFLVIFTQSKFKALNKNVFKDWLNLVKKTKYQKIIVRTKFEGLKRILIRLGFDCVYETNNTFFLICNK